MKKKIYTIFTVFTAIAGLCGCAGGTPADTELSSETVSAASETVEISSDTASEAVSVQTEPPMDTSPITLTLFINDPECTLSFEGEIAEEITARTGVTLEITSADSDEDLDELIASGNLPDLIYAGERTGELAESGLLLDLNRYMEEYGRNFSALYGERLDKLFSESEQSSEPGELYTFGTGGASPAHFTAEGSFQVRYSVLAETGYPEIKTLDQLEDCLKRYKELHPESTGLLLCGSPYQQWLDTVSARVNYVLGYPNDGEFLVDSKNGTAVYKWTDPRTKEFIKWLNELYNEDLLDDTSFSLHHGAYLDRLANGSPAAIADCYEDYSAVQEQLVSSGQDDRAYCPLPVALDENTKVVFLADNGYAPKNGIALTTACKDPERAFRFMDWLCSDEAQLLLNFGKSGEFDPNTETSAWAEPFPMRGHTEKTPDGKFYSYAAEKYASEFTGSEKAALEAYGITLFSELFPSEDELPEIGKQLTGDMEIPDLSEEAILLETLDTYVKTEVPKAITAPTEEFDDRWREITEWCETNGASRLGELMTERIFGTGF